jgi:predicted  nucleic acid-binding Zn-ribbon protein
MESIGGTEYISGESVKLSIQLIRGASQNPVADAACDFEVYYPNETLLTSGNMSHLTNGIYTVNFTAPAVEGVYVSSFNCTRGGFARRASSTFHVAPWANLITDTYTLLVAMNATLGNVYNDTQAILTKWDNFTMQDIWDKMIDIETAVNNLNFSGSNISINNTEVINAIAALEGIVNSTRDELNFTGKNITAYEYFVQLDSVLVNVNQTLFNKIEFEANATRQQIMDAIQGNSTLILDAVTNNSNDLSSILTNWGNATAAEILGNVTENRNELITMQAWLNVFNVTEADRHNTTWSLINDLLAWLGIFNQTEEQRHNFTQIKIDQMFAVINDTNNIDGNNNITLLAQQIDLTTYQILNLSDEINETVFVINMSLGDVNDTVSGINDTISEINDTVTDINQTINTIYAYLQNTIYPAVANLELKLNQTLANQTNLWNKLIGIQGNVTTNYNEIINTQNQLDATNATIMAELADHRNRLIEINTTTQTILTNITLTINPKLDQLQTDVDLIEGYTDALESGQNEIKGNLSLIINYTDSVEEGIANLTSDIQNFNTAVGSRFDAVDGNLSLIYSDTQDILASGVHLDGITNQTLYAILDLTQDANTTVQWVQDYLNGAITQYLADINDTVDQVNDTITQINDTVTEVNETVFQINMTVDEINDTVTEINQTVAEINQKVVSIYDLLVEVNTTVNNIYVDTQAILTKWDNFTMQDIWDQLIVIETAINNLNLSGFNVSVNNTDVLNAIAALEGIVNSTRDELNFTGKGISAYEYFVRLENELYNVNTTVFNKIEFEHNLTGNQILTAIEANHTLLYNQLLNNSNKLDQILFNWGNATADEILGNITETRNTVVDIENWLIAFNVTEFDRYNSTYTYIGGLFNWFTLLNQTEEQRHNLTQSKIDAAFAVINDTEELVINLTRDIGYNGTGDYLYDDIQLLISQTANVTVNIGDLNVSVAPIDYVILYEGKNLFALPKEPTNPAIATVLSGIDGSYYRVDFYNQTSGAFQTYNPVAPFGNNLTELHTGSMYWIWMYNDDILFIE